MFCSRCGASVEEGRNFCHNCGAPLTPPGQTEVLGSNFGQTEVLNETPWPTQVLNEDPGLTQVLNENPWPTQVPSAPPAYSAPPAAPVKKKSSSKKILVITSIVTVLALVIGIGAWFLIQQGNSAKIGPTYLLTSATFYDAAGNQYVVEKYEYTDDGRPLKIEKTAPDYDYFEVWNPDLNIYEFESTPNGGKKVTTYTYAYNDEGHCIYDEYTEKIYNSDGDLVKTEYDNSTKNLGYKYSYNDDGTIETIDYRSLTLDGGPGKYMGKEVYNFDKNGNLVEITDHNDYVNPRYICDFRYDSNGRLTTSTKRTLGGMIITEYEYTKDGQLKYVRVSTDNAQAVLDDQHIEECSTIASNPSLKYEIKFDFNNNGDLVSRKVYDASGNLTSTTTCEYDGKTLRRIIYDDRTIELIDDEDDIGKIDPNTIVMVRDENGNVVKSIDASGYYVEYQYQVIDLNAQEAKQYQSILYSRNKIDLTGRYSTDMYLFGGSIGFVSYVPFPTTDLYNFDVIFDHYHYR